MNQFAYFVALPFLLGAAGGLGYLVTTTSFFCTAPGELRPSVISFYICFARLAMVTRFGAISDCTVYRQSQDHPQV